MSDGDFIDSNIFIYLMDPSDPAKRRTAEDLISAAVESGSASISFQVVQETLNVMTRRLRTVVTVDGPYILVSAIGANGERVTYPAN